ncbi:MAG: hypothetical protein CMJ83_03460 [Planctomycetes bacterium]|nr:hypothetical protein [Planctomycetota bacterium]
MKNLLMAIGLTAVTLTIAMLVVNATSDDDESPGGRRDAGASGPGRVFVLTSAADKIEVLVRNRYAVGERQRFTDQSLSRTLGLPADQYTYLEMIVVNGSDKPVVVDPSALLLETAGEEDGARGYDLNVIAKDRARARLTLQAFAPRADRPLEARSTRRVLVAIPRRLEFASVVKGSFLGHDLAAGLASRDELIQWLARPRPGRLIEAVLESPDKNGGNGK